MKYKNTEEILANALMRKIDTLDDAKVRIEELERVLRICRPVLVGFSQWEMLDNMQQSIIGNAIKEVDITLNLKY